MSAGGLGRDLSRSEVEGYRPSCIRTRDLSVMSRGGVEWQGMAHTVTGSQTAERSGVCQETDVAPVCSSPSASTGRGAPVVRTPVRALVRPVVFSMLTVCEVATKLAMSKDSLLQVCRGARSARSVPAFAVNREPIVGYGLCSLSF